MTKYACSSNTQATPSAPACQSSSQQTFVLMLFGRYGMACYPTYSSWWGHITTWSQLDIKNCTFITPDTCLGIVPVDGVLLRRLLRIYRLAAGHGQGALCSIGRYQSYWSEFDVSGRILRYPAAHVFVVSSSFYSLFQILAILLNVSISAAPICEIILTWVTYLKWYQNHGTYLRHYPWC